MSSNRSKALRDMRQALSASAIAPAGARSPGAIARDGPQTACPGNPGYRAMAISGSTHHVKHDPVDILAKHVPFGLFDPGDCFKFALGHPR